MAKFCSKCGKYLLDDEVCDCKSSFVSDREILFGKSKMNKEEVLLEESRFSDKEDRMFINDVSKEEVLLEESRSSDKEDRMFINDVSEEEVVLLEDDDDQYIKPIKKQGKSGGEKFINIMQDFFAILVDPVEAGRKFVLKGNMAANFIYMFIQALVTGLFSFFFSLRKNAIFRDSVAQTITPSQNNSIDSFFDFGNFGDYGGYNDYAQKYVTSMGEKYEYSLIKNFFMAIGFSLALTLMLAILLYLVLEIARLKLKFSNVLSIVVMKTFPIAVLDIIGCVTLTFSSTIGWGFFILSGIIGMMYVVTIFYNVVAIESNKKLLLFSIAFSLFFIVLLVVVKFTTQWFVPVGYQNDINQTLDKIYFLQ